MSRFYSDAESITYVLLSFLPIILVGGLSVSLIYQPSWILKLLGAVTTTAVVFGARYWINLMGRVTAWLFYKGDDSDRTDKAQHTKDKR